MAQKHNSYEEKPMTRFGSVQGPSRRYRRLRNPTFPAAEWTDKNPLLQRGEIGYEVDTHHVKVGDGITYWNDLPYIFDDAGQPLSTADYQMGNAEGGWTTMSQAQQDALNSGATTAKINQIATNTTNISNHIADTNNPHSVTKTQVGLGNVDNTSDLDKPISTATQTALDLKADKSTTYTKTETDTLLSGKQDTISDLATIRSNAQAGKSASDTIATYGDVVTHNASEFASSTNRINGAPLSNAASVFYGTSDTAAATTEKEVSIPSITSLDVGTAIIVQPTITSTVANSTIKLNNFAAYPMRYNGAAITTSTDSIVWNANYPSIFVFDGTYWVFAGHGLDSNTTYTLNYSVDAGQYTAGTGNYAVTRYSILAQKADGTWEKITATNASHSVATSKSVNTNGFILNQLRYYGTTTVVANGALIATNTLYEKSASVDMRYSTNCGATTTWALGDYIYLVGTIGADGLFYLDTTTWWSNALPTTNDGKLYIRLGLSLTDAGYTMSFFDDRPIFYHDGTGIKEYKVADNKQDVISDLATIRSGAGAGATAVQPGDLATVATTGDYDDLLNKPTIPAAQVNSDWNANSGVAEILNKPTLGTMAAESASDYTPTASLAAVALSGAYSDLSGTPSLATVATSGSYNDLLNKPTIPTVNNATLTIQKNGTSVATFTANASSNVTANISVPTTTNDLTNNSGFITSSDIPVTDVTVGGTSVVSSGVAVVPAIPMVNNPTITITQGGVTKGSFTLNQASGDTIALDAGGGGSVDIDNSTITKNGSNQLQAVATINANTAIGATNPVYDWVGTLAEYTTQDVATNHPDWVCYITDDAEATAYQAYTQSQCNNLFVQKGHQVIDFQEPTSANNYTWYRKYADGWVEQGGKVSGATSASAINFPITMADSNYYINGHVYGNTDQNGNWIKFGTRTTTGTTYVTGYGANNLWAMNSTWEVKGMAA